jgi:putative transposase
MDDYESLSHSIWDCRYHVVLIPKYRKKKLYGELRRRLGEVFRTLAKQKESQVLEGHLMPRGSLKAGRQSRQLGTLITSWGPLRRESSETQQLFELQRFDIATL